MVSNSNMVKSHLNSNLELIEKFKNDQDWLENEANSKLILSSIKMLNGDMLNQLYKLFPFALKLADNYQVSNKLIGIECLRLILINFDSDDLSRQGLDYLIFDSFKRLLFNQEVEVIEALLPSLLESIKIMKPKLLNCNEIITECDLVLIQIMQNMEMTSKFKLKSTYLNYLEEFIKQMNLDILKHFKRLLAILLSILDESKLHIDCNYFKHVLTALNTLIEQTKPIDEKYFPQILFSLVSFQSSLLEAKINQSESSKLHQLVIDCIAKLRESNCKELDDYLNIVKDNCHDSRVYSSLLHNL